ncbi:MAG: hypothetical protein EOP11_05470 [Proteobacteria bacterium]|nr:MAG: hypothetical protein EOP11_05470 [Pseudomonadota bacterium]
MKKFKISLVVAFLCASIAAVCDPSLQDQRIDRFERQIIKQVNKYGCGLVVSKGTNQADQGKYAVYLTYCDGPKRFIKIVTAGWNRFPFSNNSSVQPMQAWEGSFDPMATVEDFSKNPKPRIVRAPRINGEELMVRPNTSPETQPRSRCQAGPGLCDTTIYAESPSRPLLSESARNAIASGIGMAAAAFDGITAASNRFQAQFSEGVAVERELERVTKKMLDEAAEISADIDAGNEKWEELGKPQIEMLENSESLAAKSMKEEALRALSAANDAAEAMGSVSAPSETAADRSAVIGSLTEASLLALAKTEIKKSELRADGADLGGFLRSAREDSFAGLASPSEREIEREFRKWESINSAAGNKQKAGQVLNAAARFADSGAYPEANALLEEARSMRYMALGYPSAGRAAVEDEAGLRVVPSAPGSRPAGSFVKKVEDFEQRQGVLAAKEQALGVQILAQAPGADLRHRDESAFSLTSALRKLAGKQFYRGERRRSQISQETAEGIADIALGLAPGVNVVKDFYELVSGRSVVSGKELTGTERAFAAVGVATLGITTEVKAIVTLATEAAWLTKTAKPVSDALMAAEKLVRSAEVSEPTKRFLQKLLVSNREGKGLLPTLVTDTEAALKKYPELYERMQNIPGFSRTIDYVRAIPAEYPDAVTGILKETVSEDVMKWHEYMRSANGRFTIGGSLGNEGLYTIEIAATPAIKAVPENFAEAIRAGTIAARKEARLVDQKYASAYASMDAEKILDLTDADVLKRMDISPDYLLKSVSADSNGYLLPQMLGDIAGELGFTHIISRSEKAPEFRAITHLVRPIQ